MWDLMELIDSAARSTIWALVRPKGAQAQHLGLAPLDSGPFAAVLARWRSPGR